MPGPATVIRSAMRKRVILLLTFPVPGAVKTRLGPALGERGACALYRRLVAHTLRVTQAFAAESGAALEARVTGEPDEAAARAWLGEGVAIRGQGDGDLGARLERAVQAALAEGAETVAVVGADCPALTTGHMAAAFAQLAAHDIVVGPAINGGFYLIGVRRALPALFRGIRWDEREVLAQMLAAARTNSATVARLPALHTLEVPADLPAWARTPAARAAGRGGVSVVIPVPGEAPRLEAALAAVRAGRPHEIIVVGGTDSRVAEIAWRHEATVVPAPRAGGVGHLNRGAASTSGEFLLFLPAGSLPPPDCAAQVRAILARPGVAAGAFALAIEGEFRGRRWIERSVNRRARRQLPCGDQGIFLRRDTFDRIGGFSEAVNVEDYAFLRRLRRHGVIALAPAAAAADARRWRGLGALRTTVMNRLVSAGYWLRVSPARLALWQGAG